MGKILSALAAVFVLCVCAGANENHGGANAHHADRRGSVAIDQTPFKDVNIAGAITGNASAATDRGSFKERAINYREEMRRFVIAISRYGKKFDKNFIVIAQNGLELGAADGQGKLQRDYLGAISAAGVESLFYGYSRDDEASPADASAYALKLCRFYAQNGVRVLATDYCSSADNIKRSYALGEKNGFISFAADQRALNSIPKYPKQPHNVNSRDVKSIADVKNFLYLINSEKFALKRQFIDALKNTDYDMIIMDLFHFETAYSVAEIRELKTKRSGGRRLLICYMSIGEAEDYRYYWRGGWKTGAPAWLAEENPSWKGNYVVRYWDPRWQKIITGGEGSYQKKIIDAGFDGVYLDIIDAFEHFERKDAAASDDG